MRLSKRKKPQNGGDYNMKRAMELRATVDPITGMFLKSAKHPTVVKELLEGHLGGDVYKDFDIVRNPDGYFGEDQLQYVPKRK